MEGWKMCELIDRGQGGACTETRGGTDTQVDKKMCGERYKKKERSKKKRER